MSQVITKRPRLSRRIFLKGLTAAHVPVVVGLPPLISMFNSTGTAYAADTPGSRRRSRRDPKAIRHLVQRKRHSRALLDSVDHRHELRHHALPDADRPAERRHPRPERARQHVRRRRSPAVSLRADDLHALEFDGSQRPVARPDAGRRRSAAIRVSGRCRSASRRSRSAAQSRRT